MFDYEMFIKVHVLEYGTQLFMIVIVYFRVRALL